MFALGVGQLWARRESAWYRGALASTLLATGVFGWWTLYRNEDWLPALRWSILALAGMSALALASGRTIRSRPAAASMALTLALTAALAGPAAYAVATVGTPHQGGGPSVGPARAGHTGGGAWKRAVDSPELADMLKHTDTKWSAAIDRSSNAADLELSSGTAVMAIGGFSGTDPTPTLREFQDDVANHRIAFYVSANSVGHSPGWNSHSHTDIAKWVQANFPASRVGSATVYDLSSPR